MAVEIKQTHCILDPFASAHVDQVVRLHMSAFSTSFLTLLGQGFLREFYSSFLLDPLGIGFVAVSETGDVLGAVVGPLDPRGFFGRLVRRRWWAFCVASLKTALTHPATLPRLTRALRYRGDAPDGMDRALLSSIAVAPSTQRNGLGRALVQRWCQAAQSRGARGCFLTTDADKNDVVNKFYVSLGWKVQSTYTTPEGRKMNLCVYDFDR
jgi:colanic acid biosynthesis glycosyl transferase WcaI